MPILILQHVVTSGNVSKSVINVSVNFSLGLNVQLFIDESFSTNDAFKNERNLLIGTSLFFSFV